MGKLHDQVREHICALSDADLIAYIATGTEMYAPEAIEFARHEVQRRNLDPVFTSQLESQARMQTEVDRAARKAAADEPLDSSDRMIAFVLGAFCLGFVRLFLRSERLRNAGEDRKASETLRFGALGFIVTFGAYAVWAILSKLHK